eukprot:TRINITY_DN719_c2_g1_i1.p1 TRINITY_DN719_c2_g1~~TRINITY_DN719_c2_g1_i1.p1  ORF type:complete len:1683 (+),score=473.23 TRINITY_DN719_c2_g1_i1:573-5051(+)
MGRMQFSGRVASGGIVSLASLIHEKALNLASGGDSSEKSLIGNDLTRIYENSKMFALMPSSFASMVSGAVMIMFTTGLPGLAGLGMLVLVLISNQWMAKVSARRESECLKSADKRIALITRVIEGIKAVKLSTWEVPFLDRIFAARSEEGRSLSGFRMVTQTSVQIGRAAPTLACCVTFSVMAAMDDDLKVADIFAVYSVFQAMRLSLIILPRGLSIIATNRVSFKRVSDYLSQPDFKRSRELTAHDTQALIFKDAKFCHFSEGADVSPSHASPGNRKSLKSAVEAEGGAAAEENDFSNEAKENRKSLVLPPGFVKEVGVSGTHLAPPAEDDVPHATRGSQEKFILRIESLSIDRGESVALIGEVGSGKSSVISAILGDMRHISSPMAIFADTETLISDANIGFVPQKSFITCGTILENVVMGRAFDEVMFRDAVTRSCLMKDLETLPGGRYTEIGERGVTLSGGQQQRVCIARALYGDPRLLLMDDPLAAVDSHVANMLFYNIVYKRKPGQTVLISLNQHKFLKHFSKIVRMENGVANVSVRSSENVAPCTEPTPQSGNYEQEPLPDQDQPHSTSAKGYKNTLIEREAQGKGAVKSTVLVEYVRSMGAFWTLASLLIIVLTYSLMAFSDRWLAKWTSEYDEHEKASDVPSYYLYVFIGASVLFASGLIASSMALSKATVRASETLHNDCFEKVVHAPLDWFNKTPSGRILSRFTSDTSNLDVQFGHAVDNIAQQLATLAVLLGMICVIVPTVIPVVVVSCIAYWLVVVTVDKSNREVKRLGNNAMSPVLSTVGEISDGRLILRAMNLAPSMNRKFVRHYDRLTKYNYASNGIMHLGMLVSYIISIIISVCTGVLMLYGPGAKDLHPSLLALALTYSFMLPYFFLFLALFFSRFKSILTSLERLLECKHGVPQEPKWFKDSDALLPKGWPDKGNIQFEGVSLVYRPGMKPAIDNVTVGFEKGTSTGVVGRTGAGKSSLIAVLFRLNEASGGRVMIDGVDAANVGLQALRKGMAVIPQDPLLIDGTIRNNLDPFKQYHEDALRLVLDRVGLTSVGLYEPAGALSVGEKQLITLCRALMNTETRIVIMDEPTSNIDQKTDEVIQKVLREDWADKTVITIAHRINTIIDYDKILVMSDGRVAQHGPSGVLARKAGIFQELVQSSGVVLKDDGSSDGEAPESAPEEPPTRDAGESGTMDMAASTATVPVEVDIDLELKTICNLKEHVEGEAPATTTTTTTPPPSANLEQGGSPPSLKGHSPEGVLPEGTCPPPPAEDEAGSASPETPAQPPADAVPPLSDATPDTAEGASKDTAAPSADVPQDAPSAPAPPTDAAPAADATSQPTDEPEAPPPDGSSEAAQTPPTTHAEVEAEAEAQSETRSLTDMTTAEPVAEVEAEAEAEAQSETRSLTDMTAAESVPKVGADSAAMPEAPTDAGKDSASPSPDAESCVVAPDEARGDAQESFEAPPKVDASEEVPKEGGLVGHAEGETPGASE